MSEATKSVTPPGKYSADETRAWLAWLARCMQREHQSVFLIEQLQPDWLATRRQRVLYLLFDAIAIGSLTGLLLSLAWWLSEHLDPPPSPEPWIPLWLWLLVTVGWSFLMGLIDDARFELLAPRAGQSTRRRVAAMVARALVMIVSWVDVWLVAAMVFGRGFASWAGCGHDAVSCPASASWMNLAHPLVSAGYIAVIYGTKIQGQSTVKPVEALGWSWATAWRGLTLGTLGGLAVWVVYAIVRFGVFGWGVLYNLWLYPPLGLAGGFVIGGLSARVVREKTEPNEGIRLSMRNGALAGTLFGVVIGIVSCPVLVVALFPRRGWVALEDTPLGAITLGVIAALVGFAWFGGREVIMHLSLRLVLTLTRQAPANLAGFLDHCAINLDFLRKVGGGYVFIHRYLLEYFAGNSTGNSMGSDPVD